MAGSTLGLLFKVGVEAAISGAKQELDDFLKSAQSGAKNTETAFKATNTTLKETTVTFNQVRTAIGQLVGGLTLVRAFREISQSIEEIGTRSKEDFDTLQKQVESAGGHITALQRNISQELVGAFNQVKGASTGFMAEVIETSGPALITLLKDIAKWLKDLKPLAADVGNEFADTFNRLHAMGLAVLELKQRQAAQQPGVGETILEGLFPPLAAIRAKKDMDTFDESYARFLKSVTEKSKDFVAKNAGTDPDKTKKARKDITDAALEQAKAEQALILVRQDAAIADKQINEDQAKGLITQKEAATRRIAVLAELQKAETAVLDARKKAVLEDPTLAKRPLEQAKQLNDIETQRAVLRTQAAEAQREENEKTIAADQKLHDALTKHFLELRKEWIAYAEFVHKSTDDIVQDLARQAQPIPGAPDTTKPVPGTPSVNLPDPHALKDLNSILAELHTQIVRNINDAIALGGAWGGFIQTLKELFSLQNIGDQFVIMMKSVLDTFIQTGHTGPSVLRQLVAGVLRAIAEMSAEWGAFFLLMAVGFAAMGDWAAAIKFGVAGGGLLALAAGLGWAASKVGPSQAGATAGAGAGFGGGTTQAPGTVTINQGAGSALGVQLQILDALQNITTAPPGDILQRGADQNPMAVGQANNEAARRDGTVSREFLQISGLRTA